MRIQITRIALLSIFLLLPSAGLEAAPDFYDELLARGIATLAGGDPETAARQLRIAAFGLLERPESLEIAHIHLAIASARLQKEADARHSAVRVVRTERAARRYASLTIPDAVRTEFESVAASVLTSGEMDVLRGATREESTIVSTPGVTVDPPAPAAPSSPEAAAVAVEPRKIISSEVPARLAAADAALASGDTVAAAQLYGAVLEVQALDHATALRVGEGLYRTRDFKNAVRAFMRAGAPVAGEEHFHYYRAVSFYETGDYASAKAELEAALPHIEITPDVASYRERIREGS